ncbi:nucleoside phosphorylase [Caldanaerobacter sp.]|uniref:nucleoside phosphorylase n=1 Tax=Caldanaerobacter sp. TaxID=2930036 RepID=UPI003C76A183
MVFLFFALYPEAKSFIRYYDLKRDLSNRYFQTFLNDEIVLTVTGIGKLNIATALGYTVGKYGETKDGIALNIGIAGSKFQEDKGRLYLVNKIIDNERKKVFVPDVLIDHSFEEKDLETFNYVVRAPASLEAAICDMEGSGFYEAASKFFETHQIYVLKIVSDSLDFERISQKYVEELVGDKVEDIDRFIKKVRESFKTGEVFTQEEKEIMEVLSNNLHLTESQKRILYKACLHFKVREKKDIVFFKKFIDIVVKTKKEREEAFEKILSYLR